MRRPSWLIVLVTVLFVALTVRLGYWQLARAQAKMARAEQLKVQDGRAARVWRGETGAAYWQRRFSVSGVWQPQGQILLDNRVHAGQAGFHVLTPLQLADGRWLLINRGWLAKRAGVAPLAPAVGGRATVSIRLQAPTQHYFELGQVTPAGPVWQNLDWTQYRRQFATPLVAALGYQLDGQDALQRDWPAPDLGVEKHYAYAGQWFLFAALAVLLFLILHWKRKPS